MRRFKNILLGIDLSQGDRFVSTDLPPPSLEAVERALWLAKANSARLTYFYALDVSPATQRMIESSDGGGETIVAEARSILNELAERARDQGVTAHVEVRFGKSWLELIRQVLRSDHDLVIAGTRHLGSLPGFLLGSTGMKLLRKCPVPVWITQPRESSEIKSTLVTYELNPVGELALELGCSMAELQGSQLHVLHALDVAHAYRTFPSSITEGETNFAERPDEAEQHIRGQLAKFNFIRPPQVHVVTDRPDVAILEHINRHAVELVVMGTVARSGIAGFIVGNTAERLLPQIPCSVLAVKPEGFVSPVKL